MKKRWKSFRRFLTKILKIALSAAVIAIILVEFGLRCFYGGTLKNRSYPLVYQPDSIVGYRYIPNVKGRIVVPSIAKLFKINSQGFYGPEFTTRKPANTFRIAIVGSSEATGIWLNSNRNFPLQLDEKLKAAGYRTEVINCSIDGRYRSIANLELVKNTVVNYEPDLVFLTTNMPFVKSLIHRDQYKGYVMIYGDRKHSRARCMKKIDYLTDHKLLTFLYNSSYIARAACRVYQKRYRDLYSYNLDLFVRKRVQAEDILFTPMASNRSADMIREVDCLLQSKDSKLVVYTFNNNSFFDTIAQIHHLPYMGLNIPVREEFSHENDGHFNEKGHAVVADSLFARIERLHLIPDRYRDHAK